MSDSPHRQPLPTLRPVRRVFRDNERSHLTTFFECSRWREMQEVFWLSKPCCTWLASQPELKAESSFSSTCCKRPCDPHRVVCPRATFRWCVPEADSVGVPLGGFSWCAPWRIPDSSLPLRLGQLAFRDNESRKLMAFLSALAAGKCRKSFGY